MKCPLICRPSNVSLDTVKHLLAAKADPNIVDHNGRTALSWAVTNSPGIVNSFISDTECQGKN